MPILIKEKFYFKGLAGEITFSLIINVNKSGNFTAYYPPEAIEFLEKRFIETRYGRAGKKGYLSEESLQAIKELVKKDFNNSLKCEPVKKYPVIKYKIKAASAFCIDQDKNIFPDGCVDREGVNWHRGKETVNSSRPVFYGINVYVKMYLKSEYETVEGLKYQYKYLTDNECKEYGEQAGLLSRWRCQTHDEYGDDCLEEIIYTEENAKFFNSLFFSICHMTLKIDSFSSPKDLQKLIDSKGILMLGSNQS
jgi:hypothetical protein